MWDRLHCFMENDMEGAMEAILFLAVWLGGASLHTLVELNAKHCCSKGWIAKAAEQEKCVRCKSESWLRDDRL